MESIVGDIGDRSFCHCCHYFCCVRQCSWKTVLSVENVADYDYVAYVDDIILCRAGNPDTRRE